MRPLEKDTPMFDFFSLLTNEIYTMIVFVWMFFGNDAPSMGELAVACPGPPATMDDIRGCFENIALMNS